MSKAVDKAFFHNAIKIAQAGYQLLRLAKILIDGTEQKVTKEDDTEKVQWRVTMIRGHVL